MKLRAVTLWAVALLVGAQLGAFVSVSDAADQWGHWRGPTGNGTSPTAKPPVRWSATENVRWKVEVAGRGSGSPVVWEDRIFLTTAVASGIKGPEGPSGEQSQSDDSSNRNRRVRSGGIGQRPGRDSGGPSIEQLEFKVLCYDRRSGELLWEKTATTATPHEGTHSTNSFASASPCTDGQHVFAHFGSQGLYAYTLDGELVWEREFGKMTARNGFGEGSSPTLVGDRILVPWDHEGPSFLYCLDKRTGETLWETPRDEPTCWATPLVVEVDGSQQVVMNGQNCARAYDLETGNELWRCAGQTARPAASAVAGDGLVFVGSGYQGSFLAAFRPQGRGDLEGTKDVVWTIERDTPDVPSPLLSDDRLYFYKGRNGILTCVNAKTGEPFYAAQRVPELTSIYASPIAAGGYVFLADREGHVTVIEDSEDFKVVATNSLGETIDATPAAVGNQLFIRTEGHLFCIGE